MTTFVGVIMPGAMSLIFRTSFLLPFLLTLEVLEVEGGPRELCSTLGADCGAECMTEYECSRVGCCWQQALENGTSQCLVGAIHRNGASSSEWRSCMSPSANIDENANNGVKVENCGWPGTTWEDCLEMGCCWNIIKQHQHPTCYKVTKNDTTAQNGFHDEDLRIHDNRLEINYNGVWGLVCGANFREREAQVACRQLGYNDTEQSQIYRRNKTEDDLVSWINFVHCEGTEHRLASCSHRPWYQNCQDQFNISCEPNQVAEARDGDVRMVGGPGAARGRLEILHNGIWGSVCNHGFTDVEASVVCRQLNHRGGRVRKTTSYGRGRKIIWLDGVRCRGNETKLDGCEHQEWGVHDCSRNDVVSIDCGHVANLTACSGGVAEVTSNTGAIRSLNYPMQYPLSRDCYWRITVEPDKIIHLNMTAFCSYPSQHILFVYDGPTASSPRVIYTYGGRHSGTSLTKLYSTSNTLFIRWYTSGTGYYSTCNPNYHGFELLYNATHQPSSQDVRLVDGSSVGYHAGRLEINPSLLDNDQSEWATVCDEDFTDNNARVVCRQLNFYGGKAYGGARFGAAPGNMAVLLQQLNCTGMESDLSECPSQPRAELCSHSRDVSVICDLHPSGPEPEEGDLRLEGGPSLSIGRLEVYHKRRWGTVCDDRFGEREAQVACRQLGYREGHVYNISADIHSYRSRRMQVWLDEVHCYGDEYVLHHCRHAGWNNSDCNHNEDIAITCSGYEWDKATREASTTTGGCSTADTRCDGELRLVGGNNMTRGMVQVYHHGEWGSICQRNLSAHEVASIACRQLNLAGGMLVPASWFNGPHRGPGRQWLDDLECSGDEGQLKDCFNRGWSMGEKCEGPAEPLSLDCGRNASEYAQEVAGIRTPRSVDQVVKNLVKGENVEQIGHRDDVMSPDVDDAVTEPRTNHTCVCRVHGDPIVNTHDDQVLRVESPGMYVMTKLADENDTCWFNVEICARRSNHSALYIDHLTIEYDSSRIHLQQNNQAQVGHELVDLNSHQYVHAQGLGFTLYADPSNTFTLFEASKSSNCSVLVLFNGQGEESVAAVQADGRYMSSLDGLCGDCNGRPDDLKTAHGEDVSNMDNKFQLITQSWWSYDCD